MLNLTFLLFCVVLASLFPTYDGKLSLFDLMLGPPIPPPPPPMFSPSANFRHAMDQHAAALDFHEAMINSALRPTIPRPLVPLSFNHHPFPNNSPSTITVSHHKIDLDSSGDDSNSEEARISRRKRSRYNRAHHHNEGIKKYPTNGHHHNRRHHRRHGGKESGTSQIPSSILNPSSSNKRRHGQSSHRHRKTPEPEVCQEISAIKGLDFPSPKYPSGKSHYILRSMTQTTHQCFEKGGDDENYFIMLKTTVALQSPNGETTLSDLVSTKFYDQYGNPYKWRPPNHRRH